VIKASLRLTVWVLVLSLAMWVALYLVYPDVPPDARDTAVIVGIAILMVAAARAVTALFRRKPKR
jgi:hypothetical protein